jgi:hypothetical protein
MRSESEDVSEPSLIGNGVIGTNQYKSVVRYGKRLINTKPKGKDRA